jgi:hypothetical protein
MCTCQKLPELRGMLAVYTTMYPGMESYIGDWYRSLCQQTDQEFQLWIGLDELGSDSVKNLLGLDLKAIWITLSSGANPAQIRQEALARIVETCSGVVLVDSDDLLHPSRVAAARVALQASEITGCALRLVDENGENIGLTLGLPAQLAAEDVFPRNNIYGFSNSAFRSDFLKRCLPIPAEAVLVDWFLATRAWLLGANMTFDRVPRMDYRQHPANTARVRYPLSGDQVVSDTALVQRHFELMLADPRPEFLAERYGALRKAAREVEVFQRYIVSSSRKLDGYVEALNALQPPPLWWTCVAYAGLEDMWNY